MWEAYFAWLGVEGDRSGAPNYLGVLAAGVFFAGFALFSAHPALEALRNGATWDGEFILWGRHGASHESIRGAIVTAALILFVGLIGVASAVLYWLRRSDRFDTGE